MDFTHIHDEAGTDALRNRLEGVASLALDLEAAGFHRYSDRMCLLQATVAGETFVVDPFEVDVGALFRGPLEDPDVEVVMHGADFDLRLLQRDLGIDMRGLFDTQIAAMLLGAEAFGLAALLEEHFDVRLTKKYQRADWADRPLTDGMLEYAAAGTHYLDELAARLRRQLDETGRAAWVEEECRALEAATREGADTEDEPVDPVTRIKGARKLPPRVVHALRLAWEWRDDIAKARDRAPFRVVGNQPLIDAVMTGPGRAEELADIKGFPRGLARNEGKELIWILKDVAGLPDEQLVGYPRRGPGGPGRPTPETEALFERLKGARNAAADAIGLPRGTLLSNAVLMEIARAEPKDREALAAIDGMRAWKLDVTADRLLATLTSG